MVRFKGVYFVKDMILTCVRVALRFRTKAIRCHNVPEKITIDGSEAHAATIRTYNQEHGTTTIMRQMKYLNHVVEQDHRSVTRVTRPMLGCKSFDAAQSTFIGIDLMHMLRKGQLEDGVAQDFTPAEPFYALAA
jgi:putative transposase